MLSFSSSHNPTGLNTEAKNKNEIKVSYSI